MARTRRKLGEILMRWETISDKQLMEALKIAKGARKRIGETLIDLNYADENDIAKALASQFGRDFIDPTDPGAIPKGALTLIPKETIKRYNVVPIEKNGNTLKILIHDPMDLELLDDLQFSLSCELETVIGSKKAILEFIDGAFSETQSSIDEEIRGMTVDMSADQLGASIDIDDLASADDDKDSPIIKLVTQIITKAVKGRASDIHIEPFSNRIRLRYRVDGVCQEQDNIPKRTQSAVVARLKIISGMKVEEKRIPQDGRIKMVVDKEKVDFRASACPSYHGESFVLRILRSDAARVGLSQLGLRDDTRAEFDKIIQKPNGIFLVTGPTGSGKTTTLYTALDSLNTPDKKIITAEDPVEYNFKGINQCQVNEQIGLGFAIILKSMLRQAPNIILVGEIRDKEVGEVAIQAALTGHLVFSTLHTNDAPSAITRLIDMGIKPFLVASSIQAVLAQRLVRLLCEKCKVEDVKPSAKQMGIVGMTKEDIGDKTIYKSVGCKSCGGKGYKGREGIYELMPMNSEIRDLAFKRAPVNQIQEAAIASGMRPLLGDGKLKVLDGRTTLEEIARIAQVEGVVDVEEDEDQEEHMMEL